MKLKRRRAEYITENGEKLWRVIERSGNKFYYKDQNFHRINGPAIEFSVDGHILVDGTSFYGAREIWCQNGKIHRINDPAVIFINGARWWYQNGLQHRENGPAIENKDGATIWYSNGIVHRKDGPAVIYGDGKEGYYFRGFHFRTKEIFQAFVSKSLTVEQIYNEQNIEIRRLFIERIGLEKFLKDSNAFEASKDEYGILYVLPLAFEEAIVVVKVKNSTPEQDGNYKNYFLRVPPHIRTAKEAVAWSFGMNEKEYSPNIET